MVHNGSQEYAKNAIDHIEKHKGNLNVNIIWIGNDVNYSNKNVKIITTDSFVDSEIQEFRKNYVHMSPNDVTYEKFCLERWLIIDNYLRTEKVKNPVIVIDSDFVLFKDLSQIIDIAAEVSFGSSFRVTDNKIKAILPHLTYFRDPEIVNNLSYYIKNIYNQSSEEVIENLKEISYLHKGKPLVSDMFVLGDFITKNFLDKNETIVNFDGPKKNSDVIISNFESNLNDFTLCNGEMVAHNFKFDSKHYDEVKVIAIHYQGVTKSLESIIDSAMQDSNNTLISCSYMASGDTKTKELFCSKNRKKQALVKDEEQEFYRSSIKLIDSIKDAKETPEYYKKQVNLNRFQFVSLPNVTKNTGYIAQGRTGVTYLVFDHENKELLVAKFIQKDLDEELKKKADLIIEYEQQLASQWQEKVGNPVKFEQVNNVIYKTYIHGTMLYNLINDDKIFANTEDAQIMRKNLASLFHKMFDQHLLITDLNSSNIIYDDHKNWVIIDGDGIKEYENLDLLFDDFKTYFQCNKYFSDKDKIEDLGLKESLDEKASKLTKFIIESYKQN